MRESKFNEFKELNWRRPLRPDEVAELQAALADDPEAARRWQAEEVLSRALERLPQAPVSSNFTARVVAAAERATAGGEKDVAFEIPWLFRGWWPRLAAGAFMMGVGFFTFQEYHAAQLARAAHREQPARQMAVTASAAQLPPVEWLNNFDTIQRLDKVKVADDELLSALQ